jgi:hypothetical protein
MACANCQHDDAEHIKNGPLVTCCHVESENREVRSWQNSVSVRADMRQCPCRSYVSEEIETIVVNWDRDRANAYTLDSIETLRNSIYTPPGVVIYEPTQERWEYPTPPPPKPKPEPTPHVWPPRRELDL